MLIYAVLLLQIVTQPLTRDKADLKTQGEDGKSQLLEQTTTKKGNTACMSCEDCVGRVTILGLKPLQYKVFFLVSTYLLTVPAADLTNSHKNS